MYRHLFASQKVCDLAQAYGSVLTSLIPATPEGFSTSNSCGDEKKEGKRKLAGWFGSPYQKGFRLYRLIISKTLLSWELPPVMPDSCCSDA